MDVTFAPNVTTDSSRARTMDTRTEKPNMRQYKNQGLAAGVTQLGRAPVLDGAEVGPIKQNGK